MVDKFFSTVPGGSFDLCIISTRAGADWPFRKILHIE